MFKKLRRNKVLSHLSIVLLNACLSSTRPAYFEKRAIKITHKYVTTIISRSWKQTPTSIREPVSKLCYFLWCCSQTEGYGDCMLRFLDHTQLHTDTLGRSPPNELPAHHIARYLYNTQTQTNKHVDVLDAVGTHRLKNTAADVHLRPHSQYFGRSHIAFCHYICADTLTKSYVDMFKWL
jgi:hypothetical protein